MVKKKLKVSLSLDERFIELAQNINLNVSYIAEEEIKEHLFPYLSMNERIILDFDRYLKKLKDEKKCFFLPFEMKKIILKNIGILQELKADFKKYNLVIGNCGKGKTTLVKSIAYMFGFDESPAATMQEKTKNLREIDLEVTDEGKLQTIIPEQNQYTIISYKNIRCIVLDGAGDLLTTENYKKLLYYLCDLDMQIILTSIDIEDQRRKLFSKIFPKCNIIDLGE